MHLGHLSQALMPQLLKLTIRRLKMNMKIGIVYILFHAQSESVLSKRPYEAFVAKRGGWAH